MWLFKKTAFYKPALSFFCCAGLFMLGACTVQPLHGTQTPSTYNAESASLSDVLSRTTVSPVDTRTAQQVRNHLLFALNGGHLKPNGRYNIVLQIKSRTANLSIANDSLAPTSARVLLSAGYAIKDKTTGKTIATGTRRTIASFDKTPQSFANERAERNAQNRAAKEMAKILKLAIAQSLSRQ